VGTGARGHGLPEKNLQKNWKGMAFQSNST